MRPAAALLLISAATFAAQQPTPPDWTKLEAETLARDFGRREGLEVVIARPIGIYGPGDTRFLKMFRGIARGRFPILGSGQIFYHLTYIDDLVEGFRRCG